MERFSDKLIGYVRPIVVTGIDVGDTETNNLAQDRECAVVVCWRPEYMRTSQLHGAVPHAGKDQIIGELECASWQCCRRRRLRHSFHVRVHHRKPRRWRCNCRAFQPIQSARAEHDLRAVRLPRAKFYVAAPIPLPAVAGECFRSSRR
jgi:hypothetical protein